MIELPAFPYQSHQHFYCLQVGGKILETIEFLEIEVTYKLIGIAWLLCMRASLHPA